MTNQEKIQYLKQYKALEQRIDELEAESDKWRTRAEKMTQTITDMPRGGDGEDKRELAMCRMSDLAVRADKCADELYKLRQEIESNIKSVQIPECCAVLFNRYICGMTNEKMAEKMNYSERHIKRLHAKAIDLLNVS